VYLALEYCAGGDLSDVLDRANGPLPLKQAVSLLRELASGLQYLHSYDIMHRDLKPQNLLITEGGHLKLGDFGFARSLPRDDMAATLCGSPLYMAPEVLSRQRYDAKCDLWSVGCIAWEMLTGAPPFTASSPMELLDIINSSLPVLPPSVEQALPPPLKELLMLLLRRDPSNRISFVEFFAHPVVRGGSRSSQGGSPGKASLIASMSASGSASGGIGQSSGPGADTVDDGSAGSAGLQDSVMGVSATLSAMQSSYAPGRGGGGASQRAGSGAVAGLHETSSAWHSQLACVLPVLPQTVWAHVTAPSAGTSLHTPIELQVAVMGLAAQCAAVLGEASSSASALRRLKGGLLLLPAEACVAAGAATAAAGLCLPLDVVLAGVGEDKPARREASRATVVEGQPLLVTAAAQRLLSAASVLWAHAWQLTSTSAPPLTPRGELSVPGGVDDPQGDSAAAQWLELAGSISAAQGRAALKLLPQGGASPSQGGALDHVAVDVGAFCIGTAMQCAKWVLEGRTRGEQDKQVSAGVVAVCTLLLAAAQSLGGEGGLSVHLQPSYRQAQQVLQAMAEAQ